MSGLLTSPVEPFLCHPSHTCRPVYDCSRCDCDHTQNQSKNGKVIRYLFEAGRYAPAAGLHEAIVPAHVLSYLPVLFTSLFSTSREHRFAKKRCNTVTGQSREQKDRIRKRRKGNGQQKRPPASQPATGK